MKHLINFKFESTRYIIWRQSEWGFFVSLAEGEADSVNLDVEVMHRELADVLHARRFKIQTDEVDRLKLERLDKTEEFVDVWLDSQQPEGAVVGFNFPDGVQIERHDSIRI
jgi:isoleucyl-tRNA synthetase